VAWRVTINGIDRTAIVDSFTSSYALNDRGRATVKLGDFLPDRYQELVSYGADGVTPIFGGIILQRSFTGRSQVDESFTASLECGDWFTYADWVYVTADYAVDVTLRQVLADLCAADKLGQYGIVLDPGQVDGPLLVPFNWANKRVSDALRELHDRTQYVVQISPAKRLTMYAPGTIAAPFDLTEAETNCHDLTWRDSDKTPYNAVTLLCGPNGLTAISEERHYGDGSRRRWPLDAPFSSIIGGLITGSDATGDDPGGHEVGIVGDPASEDRIWTVDLSTNELVQRDDQAIRQPGEYQKIWYNAACPFTVRASTGATPVVEYAEARPDVISIPVGTEIAESMLEGFQAAPRELQIQTDIDGLETGQMLSIDLPAIRQFSGSCLVTSVSLSIMLDTIQGDRFWQYAIEAIESDLYQGSYLDAWRKIAGKGAGTTAPPITGSGAGGGTGGGGTAGPASPIYLGGSRQFSLEPTPAAWLPVPDFVPYVAPADFSGVVRADAYARRPGVSVQLRLFNITDGTPAALGAIVTTNTPGAYPPFNVAGLKDKAYRLEALSGVSGEGVFGIGTLEV